MALSSELCRQGTDITPGDQVARAAAPADEREKARTRNSPGRLICHSSAHANVLMGARSA